jgi:hypothetical protein
MLMEVLMKIIIVGCGKIEIVFIGCFGAEATVLLMNTIEAAESSAIMRM